MGIYCNNIIAITNGCELVEESVMFFVFLFHFLRQEVFAIIA